MTERDDLTLLRDFAATASEAAFAALVERHVNLVYSTALRSVAGTHAAQEITQAVFIILARKAKALGANTVLAGWLHQTTRLTAANYLRGEIRRQKREQEAYMQSILNEPETAAWIQIAPLLDDAISRLGETDRNAIVLRFFENKSLREVGAALGASEDAAKMRVNRALEKLRKFFTKRGVTLSGALIAGAVSANSVQAAPVGLAKIISTVAVAKGAAATTSTLTLIKGALKIMAWTKMKTVAVVGIAALLAAGTTTVVVKKSTSLSVEGYFTRLDRDYLDTAPPMVLLRPSKYANQGSYLIGGRTERKLMRRGAPFTQILFTAYGFGPEQMVLPRNLPRGPFDMLLTVTNNLQEALQAEITKQFGLVAHLETRVTDVLVLKNTNPNAPGLQISQGGGPSSRWPQPGNARFTGYKMSDPSGFDVVHELGLQSNLPVIDETRLTNAYDIDFHWNANLKEDALKKEIQRELSDQLGLQLVPDLRPIEMLVVEKVK